MKRQLILLSILLFFVGVFFVERAVRSASGPQILYDACADGNMEAVREFLGDEKTDVNEPDKKGVTPLHVAVVRQNPKLVALLLKHGANVDAKTKTGWTPLMDASHDGYIGCMKILIEHGADVNVRNKGGWTPLMQIMKHGKPVKEWVEVTKLLLDKGADVNAVTKKGWTALMNVCRYGKPGIFRRQVVKLLIDRGADVNLKNSGDWTAFMHLFYRWDAGEDGPILSKLLIENGADVNAKNKNLWTPFMYAVRYGEHSAEKLKTVKYLLKKGADVNAKNKQQWTPLIHAVNNGNAGKEKIALVKLLIESGASVNAVNKYERSALFYTHDVQTLSLLLENGADIEARSRRERTPLIHAIIEERPAVAKALIERGCKINTVDRSGNTALIMAAKKNDGELMELLLKQDAKVNARNKNGYTPLLHASKKGNGQLITTLIKRGALVNHKTKYGKWTPLAYACRWGNTDAARVLIENGAETHHYTNVGWTPLMYAVYGGYDAIVELLKKHHPDFDNELKLIKENAAPFYLRAMEKGFFANRKTREKIDSIIKTGWKKDKVIDEYLEKTQETFSLLMEGTKKERCDLNYFPGSESALMMSNFLNYRLDALYRFFVLKGKQLQFQNKAPKSVELYLAYFKILHHVNGAKIEWFTRDSLESTGKFLTSIRDYLDSGSGSADTAAKRTELYRKINRTLDVYKKELLSPVALVEAEKERFQKKMDFFVRYMKEDDLKDDLAKLQTKDGKATEKELHEAVMKMLDEIIVKEGKLLLDQYYQHYINAARSNKDEDWRAADAQLDKLTAEMQKNEEGEYFFPELKELENKEKFSKENLEDSLRLLMKMLIVNDMTENLKKHLVLYKKNVRTLNKIQTQLASGD
jgi:ankyrin repeat protein